MVPGAGRRAWCKALSGFVIALVFAQPAAAQEPTLATVLERAQAYISSFEHELPAIVAEENYVQEWTVPPRRMTRISDPRRRSLTSDLLLVKLASCDCWLQFRDVAEVDGAAVRDRENRLERLFLSGTAPRLPVLMPAEMIERYDGLTNGSVVDGHATYSRFRRFQVDVNEKFGALVKK